MSTKPRAKAFLEAHKTYQTVGAVYLAGGNAGPVVHIAHDKDWLWIDGGDTGIMLNIEALPKLRRALANVSKERRAKR